jgi:trehalose/maltose hydrolase-like predicted phosphorylase
MRITVVFLMFLILPEPAVNAQDSSFIFITKNLSNYTPASLGNGYFSIESSLSGTRQTGSYMVWVYDHGAHDVPRIARLPAWNEINYFDGINWLNNEKINSSKFQDYKQTLDMYDGLLKTEYFWQDNSRYTSVKTETFISRRNKNLAAVKFQITPGFTGIIKIIFPVKDWKAPQRKPYAVLKKIAPNPPGAYPAEWYPGYMKFETRNSDTTKNMFWIISKTAGRPAFVAEAANIDFNPEIQNKTVRIINIKDEIGLEIKFKAAANKSYTFYKYISAVSSHDAGNYLELAKEISLKAKKDGYVRIFNRSKEAWNDLWKTDIIIKGNPQMQKTVHSMMFYLYCSIRPGTDFSIPPMGIANDGYYGHIFWDADTFMFPALLLMHPDMAESMVNFRFKSLEAAKANAKLNGFKGAMYPWESDETGNESTPGFACQNALHENHVTGDVALAQWQYYLATGNKQWLADTGYSVIKETADFWTSRVSFNKKKDRYEIKNIVSVDEGKVGINNDNCKKES